MTRAQSKIVRGAEGLFSPGTLGEFLVNGQRGWPSGFGVELSDGRVHVAKSHVTLECQGCSARSEQGQDLYKIRVSLHFQIDKAGELHERHVEDLYPMSILEALHEAFDIEGAMVRVDEAVKSCLDGKLDEFLGSCIGPMRLYEPLLNALVPPAPQDSVGGWLHEHLQQVLMEAEGVLLRLKHQGKAMELQVQQLQINRGLRCPNEVKLLGRLVAQDEATGEVEGSWRQRCTLLGSSLEWDKRKVAQPQREQLQAALGQWRDELRRELEDALAHGETPAQLAKKLEEHGLAEPLSSVCDGADGDERD